MDQVLYAAGDGARPCRFACTAVASLLEDHLAALRRLSKKKLQERCPAAHSRWVAKNKLLRLVGDAESASEEEDAPPPEPLARVEAEDRRTDGMTAEQYAYYTQCRQAQVPVALPATVQGKILAHEAHIFVHRTVSEALRQTTSVPVPAAVYCRDEPDLWERLVADAVEAFAADVRAEYVSPEALLECCPPLSEAAPEQVRAFHAVVARTFGETELEGERYYVPKGGG